MKTLRKIENRVKKMDLEKDFIPNMNDYFRYIKNKNAYIGARLEKRLAKFDLTLDEFIWWMQQDTRGF